MVTVFYLLFNSILEGQEFPTLLWSQIVSQSLVGGWCSYVAYLKIFAEEKKCWKLPSFPHLLFSPSLDTFTFQFLQRSILQRNAVSWFAIFQWFNLILISIKKTALKYAEKIYLHISIIYYLNKRNTVFKKSRRTKELKLII
jgi:hypothetical protein